MNSQRIRVPAGFAYAALFLVLCRPNPVAFFGGTALAALGLGIRVWAAGHLEKWKRLAVDGPYRYTRNPLYLGSFVMGLGFSVASASLLLLILFVLLFISIYLPVMRREERELDAAYGAKFTAYRRLVPLFFPMPWRRPGPVEPGSGSNFQWSKVILNREYQAVIGFVVVTLLVGLKMLWQ